jgi:beta-lactamase regulating signal transducer with metallopeptidase domain/thiol-disulfide isomerase/thioredoxin/protocatechuate 3,4-dioxygenase beta subunit
MIDPLGSTIIGMRAALVAFDVALKVTALMALAFACHAALGRRRALVRSALWNACFAGLLLLPAAGVAFPHLRVTALPARTGLETAAPLHEAPLTMIASPEEVHSVAPGAIDRPATGRSATPAVAEPVRDRPVPALGSQVRARPRLGAIDIAFGVYLAIATFLGVRLVASLVAVERLRQQCVPVENRRWAEALDRWRTRLGIKRPTSLLASDRVTVPVVFGSLAPAIILPKPLAGAARPGLVDAVLLHELAHVRRGDFGWNLLRKLVELVYWPHPLVWLAGRVVGAVREQACDDLCVSGLGGAGAYRESLLEAASALVRRPEPALGLAMARSTKLGARLAWIDRTRGAARCSLRWPVRMALTLAVAGAAGLLGSIELARATAKAAGRPVHRTDEPQARPGPDRPSAIEVTVRAKDTGKPLPGATIRSTVDWVDSLFNTDRDGRVRIDLSRRRYHNGLNIDAWAEGYIQQRHFFPENDAPRLAIPGQVTIELLPGEETLGGRVTDQEGKPIGGVKVEIWGYLGEIKLKEELAYMVDAATDDQGQWRCRCFRKMTFAYLYLSHPDYLADGNGHPRAHGRPRAADPPGPDEQPVAALRDFSDAQVMTRGVGVTGVVRDEQEKPVADAEVGWLEAGRNHNTFPWDVPKTVTDAQGRFLFLHARPGRLVLQIKAKRHAPELKPVDAKDGPAAAAITLSPARTLAGRIVDSNGKPIPEAAVLVEAWRGFHSLGIYLKTDAQGRFRWEDAPADSVLITVDRAGFDGAQVRVSPDAPVLITLKRSLRISGKIRDAKTEKAIDEVGVELGTRDAKTGGFTWAKSPTRVWASQGYLNANVDVERTPEFRLRLRSRGYEPFESRTFRGDEGQVEYDVSLTPTDVPQGVAVAGQVRRPDGTPLAGADVVLTYPIGGGPNGPASIRIKRGTIQADARLTVTKSDAEGRFSLTREPDPAGRYFAVVVVSPESFAEADRAAFEANLAIVAKPWGRIQGVARVGSKPAAGAPIRYSADRFGDLDVPAIIDVGETTADAQGRFVLERVVPGDVRVSIGVGGKMSLNGWSNGTLLEVKPGETARAELGGTGRPVSARIALQARIDRNGDYTANSEFEIVSDRPAIPYPKELRAKGEGSMAAWGMRWWSSAEGHEYRRRFFWFGQAKLQPDGTIRAEDVPPGEYRLSLAYSTDPVRGRYSAPERIAYATKQFTIPEIPAGRSDEPYDLGVLRPEPKQTLKAGQPAPAFDVETLDGRRVKLTDFRGKFLLLDFWATWCGPCIAEVPELKAVYDRFRKDGRFAMLSLSLDAAKEAPRRLVQEKGITWPQGFVGQTVDGGVQDAYHVEAIPAIFLIGPDGTVRAQGLSGDAIAAAVLQALAQP